MECNSTTVSADVVQALLKIESGTTDAVSSLDWNGDLSVSDHLAPTNLL